MTDELEQRWLQRLDNYCKALDLLLEVSLWNDQRGLSDLEKAGFIQRFEIA